LAGQDEWEEGDTEGSDAEGEELAEAARERAEAAMDDADWDQVRRRERER
jgi:hypothetical protein